jgi:hypothetical protein
VNDDVKAVASRVAVLETAAPLQKKTSDWMLSVVWAAAGAAVSFLAVKVGLK